MKYQITRNSDKVVVESDETWMASLLWGIIRRYDSSILYIEVSNFWNKVQGSGQVEEMAIYEHKVMIER